ncbi:MAG: thioredoxin domain-containing protein [Burkholderiales bacterium]
MPPITWLPWSAESFARASAQGKPVLLSIAAAWCRNCAEMDRTSYADSEVISLVTDHFVPIRVDADRRPDVGDRYGLGGWPTTAFLTPEGELLGGGTYVDAGRLTSVLRRVYHAFATGQHAGVVRRSPDADESTAATIEELIERVSDAFDSEHGGFGHSPKFPHVAPVRLAFDIYGETGSEHWREVAVKSLDAMGWGPLYDEERGGFFRCSHDADWRHPNEEKLLEVNATLLSLYVDAFEALQLARYGERVEDTLRYVQTWLADPVDAGWAASQRADASCDARPSEGDGNPTAAPRVDRTIFADWNGLMVSAALHAGRVMNDAGLSEFAIKSLERVDLLCYKPGTGMAHYADDVIQPGVRTGHDATVRGLLDDQIAMAAAHLDAFDATGNIVYEMMAEELALYAIRTMWDDRDGGFFDRAPDEERDIGLLNERLKPFVGNCVAARLLRRLAKVSGNSAFAGHADRTLAAMSIRAAAEGPLAAEYVLAVRAAQTSA